MFRLPIIYLNKTESEITGSAYRANYAREEAASSRSRSLRNHDTGTKDAITSLHHPGSASDYDELDEDTGHTSSEYYDPVDDEEFQRIKQESYNIERNIERRHHERSSHSHPISLDDERSSIEAESLSSEASAGSRDPSLTQNTTTTDYSTSLTSATPTIALSTLPTEVSAQSIILNITPNPANNSSSTSQPLSKYSPWIPACISILVALVILPILCVLFWGQIQKIPRRVVDFWNWCIDQFMEFLHFFQPTEAPAGQVVEAPKEDGTGGVVDAGTELQDMPEAIALPGHREE